MAISLLILVSFSRCTEDEIKVKNINILPLPKEIKLQNGFILIPKLSSPLMLTAFLRMNMSY